ncbi:peptidoglycan-binding domain-containing protein [Kitasatospora sp. NPDC094015]|uniref:peptidoglycan-binding domain-containing protein n=1 Tax=Kitasatospora sp. NPDC094015 TaxID=3155205 RepID=UPI00332A3D4F
MTDRSATTRPAEDTLVRPYMPAVAIPEGPGHLPPPVLPEVPAAAVRPPLPRPAARPVPARRRPAGTTLGLAAVIVLLLGGAGYLALRPAPAPPRPAAAPAAPGAPTPAVPALPAATAGTATPGAGTAASAAAGATRSAAPSTTPATPTSARPSGTGTPSGQPTATGPRVLTLGDTGADVADLQERLFGQGFTYVSATGTFDEATRRGIAQLQSNRGITGDPAGVYGPRTRAALEGR